MVLTREWSARHEAQTCLVSAVGRRKWKRHNTHARFMDGHAPMAHAGWLVFAASAILAIISAQPQK